MAITESYIGTLQKWFWAFQDLGASFSIHAYAIHHLGIWRVQWVVQLYQKCYYFVPWFLSKRRTWFLLIKTTVTFNSRAYTASVPLLCPLHRQLWFWNQRNCAIGFRTSTWRCSDHFCRLRCGKPLQRLQIVSVQKKTLLNRKAVVKVIIFIIFMLIFHVKCDFIKLFYQKRRVYSR